jgi:RecB family exonuclease
MDEILKRYTDQFRGSLPIELAHLEGRRLVEDQSLINRYREWNGLKCTRSVTLDRPTTNLPNRKVTHELILTGGIDDLLYNSDDEIEIIDFKTKKGEPAADYGDKYYQYTLDCYAFMLREQGLQVSSKAYLWYWWPESVNEDATIKFGQKLLYMTVNPDTTVERLDQIAKSLPTINMESMKYRPKSAPDCEYCTYVENQKNNEEEG